MGAIVVYQVWFYIYSTVLNDFGDYWFQTWANRSCKKLVLLA